MRSRARRNNSARHHFVEFNLTILISGLVDFVATLGWTKEGMVQECLFDARVRGCNAVFERVLFYKSLFAIGII